MKLKKYQLVLLHVLLLLCLALLVVKYSEEIMTFKENIYCAIHPESDPGDDDSSVTLYPVETNGDEWFLDHPMIYHAGGGIEGNTYTNSLEAVEETLSEGKYFIEMDLRYTSDHTLVCAHSWSDVFLDMSAPTLEEFLSTKVQGKYTPLTAEHLIQIMRENPEMRLVMDIKNSNLCAVITDMVALAEEDASILDRFIIQLYTGWEKSAIQEIYPFDDAQFLLTTYKWGDWKLEDAEICNQENIAVIAVPYDEMSDADAVLLRELGFTVYEHTVNRVDIARDSLERGISGFFTDVLSPEDLAD